MIRLARPDITENDISAVAGVLRSGQLVQGPQVGLFEQKVAAFTNGGDVVALNSGTSALHLALLALGIGPGHRVAVAAYSWPATANVVEACGALPVFIDIEPDTMGMAPEALASALDAGQPVSAIIPVHAFGQMAAMPEILAISRARDVPVIEDAACALGAAIDDRPAGSWGVLGCFSFHPRKTATTGEGGAVRTADPRLARAVRLLRNHGLDPDAATPDFITAGLNLRMTEFQAALGVSQLDRYRDLVRVRQERAARYHALLEGTDLIRPHASGVDAHIYQAYVVRLDASRASRRDAVLRRLRERDIEASIGTHHLPLITFYREKYGHQPGDFPVTDVVAASAIALPLHAGVSDADQEHVVRHLLRAIDA